MIFEQTTKIKICLFALRERGTSCNGYCLFISTKISAVFSDYLRCFSHKHCCETRCPGRKKFQPNIPEQTDRQTTSLTPQPSKYHHAIHKSTWPRLNIDPNLPGQQDKRRVSTMYRTRKRRRPAAPASNRQACEKRCVDYANQFQVKLCVFMRAQ